jgi:P pilus assembly chaperone PapD
MTNLGKRAVAVLAALCMSFMVAGPVMALLVRPIILDLTSSGGGVNGQIEVVNDRNTPMAVEIKVNSFTLPVRGEPVIGPDAGGDFLIFPAIAQLKPGARQVFRIRYVGNPALAASKLYMFASSELPVSETAGDEKARIEILYSITSIVAVRPAKAKAAINVIGVERAVGADKQPGLRIMFENKGSAHGYVGDAALELAAPGWNSTVGADQTSKAFGLGLIPAAARRSLFVPLKDVPANGQIAVEIKSAKAA